LTPHEEAQLGRDWLAMRRTEKDWPDVVAGKRTRPHNLISTMCLILEEMDGGAMWEADIAAR